MNMRWFYDNVPTHGNFCSFTIAASWVSFFYSKNDSLSTPLEDYIFLICLTTLSVFEIILQCLQLQCCIPQKVIKFCDCSIATLPTIWTTFHCNFLMKMVISHECNSSVSETFLVTNFCTFMNVNVRRLSPTLWRLSLFQLFGLLLYIKSFFMAFSFP